MKLATTLIILAVLTVTGGLASADPEKRNTVIRPAATQQPAPVKEQPAADKGEQSTKQHARQTRSPASDTTRAEAGK